MIHLGCDYNNGMHPAILDAFIRTNDEVSLTYGADKWTESACRKIIEACDAPDAQVFFLVGGTQTNATVIHSLMNSFQGVICVDSGHINTHEAGAIERTGHKVITLPGHDGKLSATDLENYLDAFFADGNHEHSVIPGMVYITFPTEVGTIYTKDEIAAIRRVCIKHDLVLYIDGARLGYGLAAKGCDIDLPWIAANCDVFYIGGTKVGAICGEAVVFTHGNMPKHFFSYVKQQGALLAKGRLAGIQFDTLFSDGLYFKIGAHAIDMAMKMKEIFLRHGFHLWIDSPTNQQFVLIPDDILSAMQQNALFDIWGPDGNGNTICRFVTCWATDEDVLAQLDKVLSELQPS